MNAWPKSILNYYIYSSLHISIVATLFCAETYFFLCRQIDLFYLTLVFCSTLFIYSLHRIIGITKVDTKLIKGRFLIISNFKRHLFFFATTALAAIVCLTVYCQFEYLLLLLIVGAISVSYTLPIFPKNKRLRDIQYLKIFVISIVWAVMSIIPIIYSDQPVSNKLLLLVALEKLIYILAITLPFDVRDLQIDHSLKTKTIPLLIGLNKSYMMSYILLLFSLSIYISISTITNQFHLLNYLIVALSLSLLAVIVSKNKKSDLYFSGVLDGTIGLRSLIVIIGCLS